MLYPYRVLLLASAIALCSTVAYAADLELGVHGGATSGAQLAGDFGVSVATNLTDHLAVEGDLDTYAVQREWFTSYQVLPFPGDPPGPHNIPKTFYDHHQAHSQAEIGSINLKVEGPALYYLHPYLIAGGGYQTSQDQSSFVGVYGGGVRFAVSQHWSADFRVRGLTGSHQHMLSTFGVSYRF